MRLANADTTKLMVALSTLLLCSFVCGGVGGEPEAAGAPAVAAVERGEIGIEGTIVSVDADAKRLILEARSVVLPGRDVTVLDPSRNKVVIATRAILTDEQGKILQMTIADLKSGAHVFVIGKDSGSGTPLAARLIRKSDDQKPVSAPSPPARPAARLFPRDFAAFERGLVRSSEECNKYDIPELLYKLSEEDARDYFQRYFSMHPMTGALVPNLGYPVFYWGANHKNLQKGITPVLMESIRPFFVSGLPLSDANAELANDQGLYDHIFYSLVFLETLADSKDLDNDYKKQIGEQLLELFKASRLGEAANTRIDPEKYRFINPIKTQFLLCVFEFSCETDDLAALSKALALPGERGSVLSDLGILLIDNGGFDKRQIEVIRSYVLSLPAHLRLRLAITCWDRLVSPRNTRTTVHNLRGHSFNVFGVRVGAVPSKDFPDDYGVSVQTDGFTVVLAHEYTHNVDAGIQPPLSAFRDSVRKAAGRDHANYLRSMIDDGFFENAPQEFLASMGNQYFSSTHDMLLCALQKAEAGNLNQINQFALMASVFSDSENAYFYRIDTHARIKVRKCPVKKKNGLVTELTDGPSTYTFHYAGDRIERITAGRAQ